MPRRYAAGRDGNRLAEKRCLCNSSPYHGSPKTNDLVTRTVSVLFFGRNSRASGMRSAGRGLYVNPGICGRPNP